MRFICRLLAMLAALSLAIQPAAAQSVLRDTETEALLQDMAAPLVKAAGLAPGNVDIILLNDPSINAFVAGGQAVYIHSGLISAASSAEEVQGVIAHELGHITGGHIIRFDEGAKAATNITLLSLLLGVAAAAAGGGEAAMGVLAAGQQAAMGKFLSFTRIQEASADAASADFLSRAGISGRGSIAFFKLLLGEEIRHGVSQSDEAGFMRTHPLTGDRIAALQATFEKDPAWDKPADPKLQQRFLEAKAKLYGYLAEPAQTLVAYPVSRNDVAAHYARAYAYHKQALVNQALTECAALLQAEPDNPYFLELKGQILLESGRPAEALAALRQATRLTGNAPLIATTFGHALIATEDPANYDEAERVLKAAVARDRENPFAWNQLGTVYAARGDLARAKLASAEQQVIYGRFNEALQSSSAALAGLPEGTPDWIRAQDITLQARAELERAKKGGKSGKNG
ncbi:MAG: M48 family metalloprotease [Novosphingobium sp.]